MNKDLMITQQDLIDWIDRPPSNDDLDLCNYLSNAVKNQCEYKDEIERLNNIINELEEVLKDNAERCNINAKIFKKDFWLSLEEIYKNLLDKLQELKEKE